MKNLKTIALILTLSIFSSVQMNAEPKHENHDSIKRTIANKISFPSSDHEGVVNVRFTFTEEGVLDIVDVNSLDPQLSEYIKDQLLKIELKGAEIHAKELFILKFVIKKET